jgi:RHS repeat-associated protein
VQCRTPGSEVWRYGYDPFGRRVWKKREPTANDAVPSHPLSGAVPEIGRAYCWDGDTVAEDAPIGADGAILWDHAVGWHFEPGTFRPLARTQEGRIHWVVTDHLGTPRELFDETGGLAWAASHFVWGDLRTLWRRPANDAQRISYPAAMAVGDRPSPEDDAQFCPIRFQGQWADAETGLCYNRFRHYDPQAAEYVSPDPIGLDGGPRLHGYVGDPLGSIDPLGLACTFEMQGYVPGDVVIKGPHGNIYAKKGRKITEAQLELSEDGSELVWQRWGDSGNITESQKNQADKAISNLLSDKEVIRETDSQLDKAIANLEDMSRHGNAGGKELAGRQLPKFRKMKRLVSKKIKENKW